MIEKQPERGQGRGVGNPPQGQAGWKYCVCPKCGYTEDKTRGVPCLQKSCAKCGTKMVGSNTSGKVSAKDIADSVIDICSTIHK